MFSCDIWRPHVDPISLRQARNSFKTVAVVLDALERAFGNGVVEYGAKGMIAGFGPGITAEEHDTRFSI